MGGKRSRHISNGRRRKSAAHESNRLAFTTLPDGSCRLYDGTSLQQIATIDLKDDADNVRFDKICPRFWVSFSAGGAGRD